jgi:hypothetical protein
MLFVLIFKIQKTINPGIYYSVSFYLIEMNVTVKQVLVRLLLILTYSSLLSIFIEKKIVIIGVTLGAFLIIWPAIMHPRQTASGFQHLEKKKQVMYFIYLFVFVFISFVSSFFGSDFSFFSIFKSFLDNWFWGLILSITLGTDNKYARFLSLNLVRGSEEDDDDKE